MAATTHNESIVSACADTESDAPPLALEFIDYSLHIMFQKFSSYDNLILLFENLTQRADEITGFWHNRDLIALNTSGLVIAVDSRNGQQLGFVLTRKLDSCPGAIIVDLIESFVLRKRVATRMLEYVASRDRDDYERSPILVDRSLPSSMPFWKAYFGMHKDAGMLSWWMDMPEESPPDSRDHDFYLKADRMKVDRLNGPLMEVMSDISRKTFLKMLDTAREEFSFSIELFRGGRPGLIIHQDDSADSFAIEFPFYLSPVEANWRETWATDDTIELKAGEYKTYFAPLTASVGFYDDGLDLIKKIFGRFGIIMNYVY